MTPSLLQHTRTLHFPTVKAWRAQKAVLDGVETCPPGHPTNRRARWGRRAGSSGRAVFGRVYRGAFGGGEWASSWGGVRGHLCCGDRFAVVVRVEAVTAEGGHRWDGGERNREFRGNGQGWVAPHPWAVGDTGSKGLYGGGGLRFGGGGRLS